MVKVDSSKACTSKLIPALYLVRTFLKVRILVLLCVAMLLGRAQGKTRDQYLGLCNFQKKRWEDNIKEWTGMDFASSTRAAENMTKWKGIVANSSVVPRRPSKVMG